jgi:PEP-CTERM motif
MKLRFLHAMTTACTPVQAVFWLTIFASSLVRADSILDPLIYINGTSSGTAVAGVNSRGVATTAKQLADRQKHAADYDGPTEFSADYTIVIRPDNTIDASKSSVIFQTINYTGSGKLVESNFKTLPIQINDATVKDGKVVSFSFEATNWYPDTAQGANTITNNELSGSIDLTTGKTSYIASYISKSTGAVYLYTVTGDIKKPMPEPGPQPDAYGDPEVFTPVTDEVPEPTTLLLLGGGLIGFAILRVRRSVVR